MLTTEWLLYRPSHASASVHPGAHRGRISGAGPLFKTQQPLMAWPDPRRIDLRASLLDPFQNYRVRAYQQHSVVSVYLVADLSASMGYGAKRESLARFLLNAAYSAAAYHDPFGFIGAHRTIEARWLIASGQHAERVERMARELRSARLTGSASGLSQAATFLPPRRSLVFLVSDFHWPEADLHAVLGGLQGHDLIPLVLWDAAEYSELPEWGILAFQDMEQHRRRTLFMRPSLKGRILAAYARRRQMLTRVFRAFGYEALFIEHCDMPSINRHLQQRAA